jgi:hypothetical protein
MPTPPGGNVRDFPNPLTRRRPIDDRTSIDPSDPSLLGSIHTLNAVVYLAGANVTTRIRVGSVKIDQQTGQPDRCSFLMDGTGPLAGQEIKIGLGDTTLANLLFAGSIVSFSQVYEGQPANVAWQCECIDYTWLLNRRRPYGPFTGSATAIAKSLIATFSSGFTAQHVDASLPTVSLVFDGSATFADCLGQLVAAASTSTLPVYWYVDYARDLHVFTVESTNLPDTLDGTGTKLQLNPPVTLETDLQQLRTRVHVVGAGTTVLAPCAVGETIVPIEDASMFNNSGQPGMAITGGQVLSYTDVQVGGSGALVGPGAGPTSAPGLALANGTGLGSGVYQYAYTDVTASGESLPSPLASITTGPRVSPPPAAPSATHWLGSGTYSYALTFVTAAGETYPSSSYFAGTNNGSAYPLDFVTGPVGTTQRKIYRTVSGGATLKLLTTINNNTTISFLDSTPDGSLGADAVTALNQVSLTGIAVGTAPTTSRKVYRTVVGGAQLKLLTTIADNTTTTYTDSTGDGGLGANVPVTDTSGLTTGTPGSVLAGSTSLLTSGTGWASASGGWAIVGNGRQVIRYTGISTNTLTGIPTSGVGAILATITYPSSITGAPALIGVPASGAGAVTVALLDGDDLALWAQRDDLAAQATLAASEGGDGIHELEIRDTALVSLALCQARGDADLARFSTAIQTLQYVTLDTKTRAGKPVTVALASPTSISGTFTIQTVTIDQLDVAAGRLAPRYRVKAARVLVDFIGFLNAIALQASKVG